MPYGFHRIDGSRAARWDETGKGGDRHQQSGDAAEDQGIPRALRHPLRRELVEYQAEDQSRQQPRGNVPRRSCQHHAHDVACSGAERHSNTELVGSGRNAVRHDAVEADGGKRQCQQRKDGKQVGHEALLRVLLQVRDPAVQVTYAHHLLFAVDAHDLGAHVG